MKRKSKRGFTLVEIILAIAVASVLIIGVFSIYNGVTASYAETKKLTSVQDISMAILTEIEVEARNATSLSIFANVPAAEDMDATKHYVYGADNKVYVKYKEEAAKQIGAAYKEFEYTLTFKRVTTNEIASDILRITLDMYRGGYKEYSISKDLTLGNLNLLTNQISGATQGSCIVYESVLKEIENQLATKIEITFQAAVTSGGKLIKGDSIDYNGQDLQLFAKIEPEWAKKDGLNWEIDEAYIYNEETGEYDLLSEEDTSKVATIDSNGKIIPKQNGKVKVVVSATDGSGLKSEPKEIKINGQGLDAYSNIWAKEALQPTETISESRGPLDEDGRATVNIGDINKKEYIVFENVNFGDSETFVESVAIFASVKHRSDGKAIIYIDSMDSANQLATVSFTKTNDWNSFVTHTDNVGTTLSGIHDVYVKFDGITSSDDCVCNFVWMKFTKDADAPVPEIKPATAVRVKVTDETGVPISGILATIKTTTGANVRFNIVTNDLGCTPYVKLDWVSGVKYTATATNTSSWRVKSVSDPVSDTKNQSITITIVMEALTASTLTVEVVDINNNKIEDAVVMVRDASGNNFEFVTDEDGTASKIVEYTGSATYQYQSVTCVGYTYETVSPSSVYMSGIGQEKKITVTVRPQTCSISVYVKVPYGSFSYKNAGDDTTVKLRNESTGDILTAQTVGGRAQFDVTYTGTTTKYRYISADMDSYGDDWTDKSTVKITKANTVATITSYMQEKYVTLDLNIWYIDYKGRQKKATKWSTITVNGEEYKERYEQFEVDIEVPYRVDNKYTVTSVDYGGKLWTGSEDATPGETLDIVVPY